MLSPKPRSKNAANALHAEVTKDPLTKVANRAEFDRMQALFIEAHEQAKQPCSLIMVDIDHFKSINDTYGHQAGDEAIITVAGLLATMCRSGDLVARYGGEEFAVLCADCNNAGAASACAEEIRKKLAEMAHSNLGNRRITASFGVTELQAGDNSETMLRRAIEPCSWPRLKVAIKSCNWGMVWKSKLRKTVVVVWSIGGPAGDRNGVDHGRPIDIAIAKLRGFVSDHQAKVISTHENSVELEISSEKVSYDRRKGDRNVDFRIELEFSERREERVNNNGLAAGEYASTHIEVKIRPRGSPSVDEEMLPIGQELILQSVKAYLMAKESAEARSGRAAEALAKIFLSEPNLWDQFHEIRHLEIKRTLTGANPRSGHASSRTGRRATHFANRRCDGSCAVGGHGRCRVRRRILRFVHKVLTHGRDRNCSARLNRR